MKIRCVLIISLLSFFVGCALLNRPPEKEGMHVNLIYGEDIEQPNQLWPEDALRQSFQQYWGLRFKGDVEAIYQMEAPHVQEMVAHDRYRNYMKGAAVNDLLSVEVLKINKETEFLYTIHTNILFSQRDGSEKKVFYTDEWVKVKEDWYHLLKDKYQFPEISKQ